MNKSTAEDEAKYSVKVMPGDPEEPHSVRLEINSDVESDFYAFLDEESVDYQPVIEHSFTAFVVVTLVGLLQVNALGQLAELIEKWTHRNDGKTVALDGDGNVRELNGFDIAQIKTILEGTRQLKDAQDQRYAERVKEIDAEMAQEGLLSADSELESDGEE